MNIFMNNETSEYENNRKNNITSSNYSVNNIC